MDRSDNHFKTTADTTYEIISDKVTSDDLRAGEQLTRRGMAELTEVSKVC